MIYRFISKKLTIVTGLKMENNLIKGNDFRFNIALNELAVNCELLRAFAFISSYANKDDAVKFFISYLGAFLEPNLRLKENDILAIMVKDEKIQDSLIKILSQTNNK